MVCAGMQAGRDYWPGTAPGEDEARSETDTFKHRLFHRWNE